MESENVINKPPGGWCNNAETISLHETRNKLSSADWGNPVEEKKPNKLFVAVNVTIGFVWTTIKACSVFVVICAAGVWSAASIAAQCYVDFFRGE
jgi:hypothetical protein